MTKEEQQTIFKWLCEAIGNGAKIPFEKYNKDRSVFIYRSNELTLNVLVSNEGDLIDVIPIAKPLSMLTEPIKVEGYNEGKEFVAWEKIKNTALVMDLKELMSMPTYHAKVTTDLLLQWGFFIYDQTYFDKGYLIKESDI